MRVMLLKGRSAYDALRVFIDDLDLAFRRVGHDSTIIDTAQASELMVPIGRCLAAGPVDLVFSFNILGEIADPQGRSIGEIVGAPHVVQYVDYPLSHLDRLEKTSPLAALLMVDPSHVDLVHALYGRDRFAHVGFSPHGAVGPTVSPGEDVARFVADRPIPILFPGTFYRPPSPAWGNLPLAVQRIFGAALELALGREWVPPLEALETAMRSLGLDPLDPDFAGIRRLAGHVHEQVRARRRVRVLDAAERLGLVLHVIGAGYEAEAERRSNLVLLGEASFGDTLTLMAGSRVVLNVNANFGAGSHERPLSALNAGAAAASDTSVFYRAEFRAGEEMALYRWTHLEEDLARVGQLAGDPQAAFAMAQAGQARVLAAHGWIHRVEGILAAADQARGRFAADARRLAVG